MDAYRGDRVKVKGQWGTVIESAPCYVEQWIITNTRYTTSHVHNVRIVRFPFAGDRVIDGNLIEAVDCIQLKPGDYVRVNRPYIFPNVWHHLKGPNEGVWMGVVTNNVSPNNPDAEVRLDHMITSMGIPSGIGHPSGIVPAASVIEIFRKEIVE